MHVFIYGIASPDLYQISSIEPDYVVDPFLYRLTLCFDIIASIFFIFEIVLLECLMSNVNFKKWPMSCCLIYPRLHVECLFKKFLFCCIKPMGGGPR